MASVCDQQRSVPFLSRNFLIDKIGLQFLTAALPVHRKIVSGASESRKKTVFYYIIVKAFRVAFLWYLFRRKISLCLKDSTGDLLICPREQDLSRYPELHFLFPGVLPGFLPFCQLHTCICLHRSHPVWKVQRFPGLLLKKRGQRINMDRLDILPGSRRLSDAFCRKKFPHSPIRTVGLPAASSFTDTQASQASIVCSLIKSHTSCS